MGRQNSLMSIQIVMRVKQEKQGTIIFQTVVNWNKNTSASVQSDKQADDHWDLLKFTMNFGVLSGAKICNDVGYWSMWAGAGNQLRVSIKGRGREGRLMNVVMSMMCITLNEGGEDHPKSERRKMLRELTRVKLEVLYGGSKLLNEWPHSYLKCIIKTGVSPWIYLTSKILATMIADGGRKKWNQVTSGLSWFTDSQEFGEIAGHTLVNRSVPSISSPC